MKIPASIALAAAVTLAPASSHAGFTNGNGLWEACGRSTERARADCATYVSGAVDALEFATAHDRLFCLRRGVTVAQVADVVTQRLAANPAERDREAPHIVLTALADAFPCS